MKAKTFSKLVFSAVSFLFLTASAAFAADAYNQLAKELSAVAKSASQTKIAIIPFSYVDKRVSDGGSVVSERLTTRIVKLKKFLVIERSLLETVLKEQNLQTSGLVDAETAKQLGKILGVDAVINGTLLDVEDGMVEVNARLIKTDTAEMMTSASVQVKKIWSDVAVNQPAPPAVATTEQAQEPAAAAKVYTPKFVTPRKTESYVDFFMLSGDADMTLEFKSTKRKITNDELYFSRDATYNTVHFKSLASLGSGSFGMRFVGFPGEGNMGVGWELSTYEQTVKKQTTKVLLDNVDTNFNMTVNDYLKVTTFNLLNINIFGRFVKKGWFQPYAGAGIGMTLNTVTSPYVTQKDGSLLNDFNIGVLFNFPTLGVRFVLGESFSLFYEMRTLHNTVWFQRGYATGEEDVVYTKAAQSLMGLGFKF